VTWRRLAALTAAGLVGIHACRVYDESDTELGEDIVDVPSAGGRASASGGGSPPFIPMTPGGSGGSSGAASKGGAAPGASGGRGGNAPAGGGTTGAVVGSAGSAGDGDSGDPGSTPAEGGAPGEAGASNQGGAPDTGGGTASGGNTASGGSGGGAGGGASAGGSTGIPLAPELIDDCEDGNNRIKVNAGRDGYWSTFDAAAGCTLTPTNGMTPFMSATQAGTGSGEKVLHFVSTGDAADGCGVNLEFTSAPVEPYDASDYVGISFGARSTSGAQNLLFKVAIDATDPRFELCDPMAAEDSMMQCYDHFQTTVMLTAEWQELVVTFSELAQEGWGLPAGAFDASKLVAVQWVARPGTADIWIDDVKFVAE
jgi:hypothetical protein